MNKKNKEKQTLNGIWITYLFCFYFFFQTNDVTNESKKKNALFIYSLKFTISFHFFFCVVVCFDRITFVAYNSMIAQSKSGRFVNNVSFSFILRFSRLQSLLFSSFYLIKLVIRRPPPNSMHETKQQKKKKKDNAHKWWSKNYKLFFNDFLKQHKTK